MWVALASWTSMKSRLSTRAEERLLCKLAKEGAQFTASGTYTKPFLSTLNVPTKTQQLEFCSAF